MQNFGFSMRTSTISTIMEGIASTMRSEIASNAQGKLNGERIASCLLGWETDIHESGGTKISRPAFISALVS